MFWTIAITIYLASSVLAYGTTLAAFQRGWPRLANEWKHRDIEKAFQSALFGPIGLFVTLMLFGFKHGIMFRPQSQDRMIAQYQKDNEELLEERNQLRE